MKTRIRVLVACGLIINTFAWAGEISSLFEKARKDGKVHSAEPTVSDWEKPDIHGVTEIGIERHPGMVPAPVYTFRAKSDGTFGYNGTLMCERMGNFTGTISPWKFAKVALLIKESDFVNLKDDYFELVTDQSTVFTTAVIDGKRKTIKNYASAGPAKLWAVEELIDQLLAEAEWDQPATTQPDKAAPNKVHHIPKSLGPAGGSPGRD